MKREKAVVAAAAVILVTQLCGCVRRYAQVIASSSPPLCQVREQSNGVSYGHTPAYIDVTRKFFILQPHKVRVTYVFELAGYKPLERAVVISKWAKTEQDGHQSVTYIYGVLDSCDCAQSSNH